MTDEKEKKFMHARVSARVLYALTPLIQQANDLAHSLLAFYNQMDTRRFGCYLLPADEGILAVVVQGSVLLAIRDPKGLTSEPLKVNFPDGLLEKVAPRFVSLCTQDGDPFEVESEPKAEFVLCSEGFGIVFLGKEAAEKYEGGAMGTWFNGDHGNMIDSTSYRAETPDITFISKVIERAAATQTQPISAASLNPALLKPITEAACRMGLSVDLAMGGAEDPVTIRSSDDSMFGLLMPMKSEQRGPSPLIDILSRKEKAATATA